MKITRSPCAFPSFFAPSWRDSFYSRDRSEPPPLLIGVFCQCELLFLSSLVLLSSFSICGCDLKEGMEAYLSQHALLKPLGFVLGKDSNRRSSSSSSSFFTPAADTYLLLHVLSLHDIRKGKVRDR